MASHVPLRGLYEAWTRWLIQHPQEAEMKVLFSLLPKILSRFASSKSTQLIDSLPQLSPFLIQVGSPCLLFVFSHFHGSPTKLIINTNL